MLGALLVASVVATAGVEVRLAVLYRAHGNPSNGSPTLTKHIIIEDAGAEADCEFASLESLNLRLRKWSLECICLRKFEADRQVDYTFRRLVNIEEYPLSFRTTCQSCSELDFKTLSRALSRIFDDILYRSYATRQQIHNLIYWKLT